MGLFTLREAREELAALRPVLDELVVVRADAAELAASLSTVGAPPTSAACRSSRPHRPGSTTS